MPTDWSTPPSEYTFSFRYSEAEIRVSLSEREKEFLQRQIHGQGGYQSLLRRLVARVQGDELVLSTTDAERLIRSAERYGEGGFQNRLRPIADKVRKEWDDMVAMELAG